jgi:hypothetical protein
MDIDPATERKRGGGINSAQSEKANNRQTKTRHHLWSPGFLL